ncbi:MAG TPA: ATP-binding protein [Acidobacteriota bacterium]|nr:ATP-binding protein [Acidobacteriota bacterium]
MSKISQAKLLKLGTILILVCAISLLHFFTSTEHIYLHQVYQRSYYIPIVLASFWFEVLGGLATALGLTAVYLVHILRDWSHHSFYSFQQYTEIVMYLLVSLLLGYLSRNQRKARERLETTAAELTAAYERLNQTFDQLRQSERLASLGQLSAGLAHEIRNPLGSIQGAVEILSHGVSPEDPKSEFAQIAKREVANLHKLVGDILKFSKPAPPLRLPSDVDEIVDAARRLCADQARKQGVEIILQRVSLARTISVDAEQLKQVLLNILLNAIQAQPTGGRVVVRSFAEMDEAVISIEDSGPGIEPENLDRIFDPFFTTKREGTGLGLSISYQLVRNNGGRIRVTSSPGQGACFLISFPFPPSQNVNDPKPKNEK